MGLTTYLSNTVMYKYLPTYIIGRVPWFYTYLYNDQACGLIESKNKHLLLSEKIDYLSTIKNIINTIVLKFSKMTRFFVIIVIVVFFVISYLFEKYYTGKYNTWLIINQFWVSHIIRLITKNKHR